GITFIGPNKETMEMMGSKLVSRQKMQEAGVPVVPGSDKELTSIEEAIDTANELTYPLMLKASAGGGGIGMKYIENEDALVAAYEPTQQQAENFFSDGRLFLEKIIENQIGRASCREGG